MWVARDKYTVRCKLFARKPKRRSCYWSDAGDNNAYENVLLLLDSDLFPNLKWEDEPLPVELNEIGLPSTKPDKQDDKEVQEMQSDIDELERICNEMTDEEFLESYKESTKGMRDDTEYDDFLSERPCDMGNKYTKPKTEEEVTNSKKTMGLYTIYCTEEQTKKALELGAPIEFEVECPVNLETFERSPYPDIKMGEDGEPILINPTAEQMIGWLEEQGILVLIDPSQDKFYGTYSLKREDGYWLNRIFLEGLYSSRKDAIIATIDSALDYLKEHKKII